jgi:cell division protein FtsL
MKNKNKEKKEMQAPVHELSRMRRVAERGKGSRLQEGLCIGYGGP